MATNFYITYAYRAEQGSWETGWQKFSSLEKATEEQKLMKKNSNYRKVSNILVSFIKDK